MATRSSADNEAVARLGRAEHEMARSPDELSGLATEWLWDGILVNPIPLKVVRRNANGTNADGSALRYAINYNCACKRSSR